MSPYQLHTMPREVVNQEKDSDPKVSAHPPPRLPLAGRTVRPERGSLDFVPCFGLSLCPNRVGGIFIDSILLSI